MSHFTLIVELPEGTLPDDYESEIARRLERYDENRKVEPYRDYWESVDPRDNWAFEYVYETLQKSDENAPAPEDVTLERFVAAYNERYHNDEEDSEKPVEYDAETGRAFTWSTYNPESKWDWWTIGGRWRGYFTTVEKMSSDDVQRVLLTAPRWMNEDYEVHDRACDGGPIRLLDLEGQRATAVAKAEERFATYERAIAGTPEALSWTESRESHDDIEDARAFYREQPRVQALNEAFSDFGFGCRIEEFRWGRELYVHRARLSAVPGYAYLTRDDRWLSPGDMGWFGLSSDTVESREAYDTAVNGRITSLGPDVVLVLVDCHI